METVTEVVKNMAGGDGEVTIKRILGEKELNGKCGLYAQVTIQPGSSLGYHEHKNESEKYNVYLPRKPESEGCSMAVATA